MIENVASVRAILDPDQEMAGPKRELKLEDYLSPKAAEAIEKAEQIAQATGKRFVGTEQLFSAVMLVGDPEIEDVLYRLGAKFWLIGADLDQFSGKIGRLEPVENHIPNAGATNTVILLAAIHAHSQSRSQIQTIDFLVSLAEETQGITPAILKHQDISSADIKRAIQPKTS